MRDIHRQRGIFTKADRQFLEGNTEMSRQARSQRRQEIEDRTVNAILDLAAVDGEKLNQIVDADTVGDEEWMAAVGTLVQIRD